MTTRRFLFGSLTVLGLLAPTAWADDAKVLILRARIPTGITVVPPTTFTGTTPVYWNPPGGQYVIPRYANGVTHPAGQLIGWGSTSVIQATSQTASQSVKAIVVTEGFGNDQINQWQNDVDTEPENQAILQPIVRDVTVVGRDLVGDGSYYTSGSSFPDQPGVTGADTATIKNATNASPIVLTTASTTGLVNGEIVTIGYVIGNTAANGVWEVANVTGTTFELVGSAGNGAYVSGATWTSGGASGIVLDATNASPIVLTTRDPHGLTNGASVTIAGVQGNTNANGTYTVAGATSTTFQLQGTTDNGAYKTSADWRSFGGAKGTITGASGSPIVITSANHALPEGAMIYVSGVGGNTAANGLHTISVVDANSFKLSGFFSTGTYTNGGQWICTNTTTDQYGGYYCGASGAILEGVNWLAIPGTAAKLTRYGTGATKGGGVAPFDNEKLKVERCNIARCYRGFEIDTNDAIVGRLSGHNIRDFGIKLTVGATQFAGSAHFWGVVPGPAVWAFGSGNWGGPIYAESSGYGVYIRSSNNDFGPLYVHSNAFAGVYIEGNNNKLWQVSMVNAINVLQPIGVHVAGQYNTIANSRIDCLDGCFGVYATGSGGIGLRLRDVQFNGNNKNTTKLVDLSNADVYYCDLDIHVQNGGVGLDLEDDNGMGRLQTNNHIHVRTPNQAPAGLTTMIDMPGGVVGNSNVVLWNNFRVGGGITGVSAASQAVITSNSHGLVDGDQVIINDVAGTVSIPNVNSWQTLRTVDAIDTNTFSVPVDTTGGGSYTTRSGWWGKKP